MKTYKLYPLTILTTWNSPCYGAELVLNINLVAWKQGSYLGQAYAFQANKID